MAGDCFGPVSTKRPRHGECRYCFDENNCRETHCYFEPRQRMVGPVCGHRLRPPKRTAKVHRNNALFFQWRNEDGLYVVHGEYWGRRAILPDYCGEPGELRPGLMNDLIRDQEHTTIEAVWAEGIRLKRGES